MSRAKWVAPSRRGKRAARFREAARGQLDDALRTFALECEQSLSGHGTPRNFAWDGVRLIEHPEVRAWVADAADQVVNASRRDAEAAVVSAYCDVVTADFHLLYGAYERWIASRLRASIKGRLQAVGVRLCEADLADMFLRPLARFALDSLRMLWCDVNRLAAASDGRSLPVRPFGWAPGRDDFDVALSLLLVCQAKGRFLPEGFKYSPLGRRVCSEVLARLGRVERRVCNACGKEFRDRREGSGCPECPGQITTSAASYLFREEHPETDLDAIVVDKERSDPRLRAEREECCSQALAIGAGRAAELWREVIGKRTASRCQVAVLLSLAGLDCVPACGELGSPRREWLENVALAFHDGSLTGQIVASRARRLFETLPADADDVRAPALSGQHVRTIVSRFRDRLFGAEPRPGRPAQERSENGRWIL